MGSNQAVQPAGVEKRQPGKIDNNCRGLPHRIEQTSAELVENSEIAFTGQRHQYPATLSRGRYLEARHRRPPRPFRFQCRPDQCRPQPIMSPTVACSNAVKSRAA